jgi:hypothetical protein
MEERQMLHKGPLISIELSRSLAPKFLLFGFILILGRGVEWIFFLKPFLSLLR